MSRSIVVEDVVFEFPDDWEVEDFDAWYSSGRSAKPLTNDPFNAKDCDLIAFEGNRLWLIEVKDYTYPGKRPDPNLATIFALKVFHTMARLMLVAHFGNHPKKDFCRRAVSAEEIRVALAIEMRGDNRMLPLALAGIKDNLDRKCAPMKVKHITVSNSRFNPSHVGWSQRRVGEARGKHSDR
ncbi:hypothetical protein CGLAUT_09080 [Corynebacterium glaucum]|nr:hypothetical protein CGLAUT_09080 [Corynebacterium glaucum]